MGPKVTLGEGGGQWKKIFQAAEKTGEIDYYLIEQEGADTPPLETVERCLAAFRKLHPAWQAPPRGLTILRLSRLLPHAWRQRFLGRAAYWP